LQKLIQIADFAAPAVDPLNNDPAIGGVDGSLGKKIGWISLGCPKNLVDSEGMMGDLGAAGYTFTPDIGDADAVVVNTCGFIDAARDESLTALRTSLGVNRRGAARKVIAVGCLAQRLGEDLFSEAPGLDAVVGMGQQADLTQALSEAFGQDLPVARLRLFDPMSYFPDPERRLRLTPAWFAYIKISDGCDNPCTFCSIPLMRGKMRSRSPGEIEREARFLASRGVQELILIAQDSTHYGDDTGEGDIAALLSRLARIDGPRWIRLMYAYPTRVNDRLIEVIASEPKVCKYIDMPLQHASDPVLAAMKRPGTAASYLRLLERIRRRCPEITIRTTMILGFPGETEDDFRRLLDFVEEARFDRLGAFRYSPEPGTPAAERLSDVESGGPGAPSRRVVDRRYDRLMRLQQRISLERNREWIGRRIPVLVEGRQSDGALVCRSGRDAPEIDGNVFVTGVHSDAASENDAAPGSFIEPTIVGARPYDLLGQYAPA